MISKDYRAYQGTDGGPGVPGWVWVVFVLLVATGWLIASRWLFFNTRDFHQGWNDGGCFSGAPTWATVQGAIALVGLIATALGGARYWSVRRTQDAWWRAAVALAGLALLAWLVTVFALDPRESLGVYAGCGAA